MAQKAWPIDLVQHVLLTNQMTTIYTFCISNKYWTAFIRAPRVIVRFLHHLGLIILTMPLKAVNICILYTIYLDYFPSNYGPLNHFRPPHSFNGIFSMNIRFSRLLIGFIILRSRIIIFIKT
jgi:hypothetical protein